MSYSSPALRHSAAAAGSRCRSRCMYASSWGGCRCSCCRKQAGQLAGRSSPDCHCANATASSACWMLSQMTAVPPTCMAVAAVLWLLHFCRPSPAVSSITGSDWLPSGLGKSTAASPAACSRCMRMSSPESWKIENGRSRPANPAD